jgi:hypothetical protein
MVSEALQALYEGDRERADELRAPDDELPAYEAAAFGRIERLQQLLDEDPANANAWSPDGFTALHLAIFGGSDEAVRLLVERGADVDALATPRSPGEAPRHGGVRRPARPGADPARRRSGSGPGARRVKGLPHRALATLLPRPAA